MIHAKKIAVVGVLMLGSLAFAEDDLVSILDGKSSTPAVAKFETKSARILSRLLPNPTAEQVIFLHFLKNGDFEKALYQWPDAFHRTDFEKSPNGQALWAYLLYKNNLLVNGVETLFRIREPQMIDGSVTKLWSETVPADSWIWKVADLNWSDEKSAWTGIFGEAVEVTVRARSIQATDPVDKIERLLKKTHPNTMDRAWIEWQYALGLIRQKDVGKAAKILKHLVDSPVKMVGNDHLHMTAGRLLYERGYLDAAGDYYDKVNKASDFWVEAQEEASWTFLRKGEPQNAIARLQTLMNPIFKYEVGPETVYLNALAHLKICDYPAVVETITEFKTRFKSRAQVLEDLKKNPDITPLFARLRNGRTTLKDLGPSAKTYPRLVTRDEVTFQNAQKMQHLEQEAVQAGELYARSLAGGSARVGFVAKFEELKNAVQNRSRAAEGQAINRVKQLADAELEEIKQMLQKMQVVEAEVIQQIQLAGRLQNTSKGISDKKGTVLAKSQDRLQFPAEKEVWLDEIAHYKLDLKKACQSIKK